MKSTAKKQSVYYHVTRFGDAAQILKTGKLICGRLNEDAPALIVIGSACSTQPVVVEPLVTPKPFALRM